MMKVFNQEKLEVQEVLYDNDIENYVHKDNTVVSERIKLLSDIDWEQRRYEIAKECLANMVMQYTTTEQYMAQKAMSMADIMIMELQKVNNE